jgi:chorismate synthase
MSTFGDKYRVTTFGESHSLGVGVVVDGFPHNFKIDREALQTQLNRRKPGQTRLTT